MGVLAQFFYVGAQVCVFSLFILYAQKFAGISAKEASIYVSGCGLSFIVCRFLGTILMKFFKASHLLVLYVAINILLCIAAALLTGIATVYVVVAICFFMSIMFPAIFALALKDLGNDTEFGSSLIIMSIVGGVIVPLIFGLIGDQTGNIQLGYFVPIICFIVVAFFALKVTSIKISEVEPSGTL